MAEPVAEARKWLGTRWRHQGRGPAGVDCLGLVVMVADALGLPHHDRTDYGRRPEGTRLMRELDRLLPRVHLQDASPGDVLVIAERAQTLHVGIQSEKRGAPHIIHAHAHRRKVIEEPLVSPWAERVVGVFRLEVKHG
ncbi:MULTISPECIES: C40 family peptidase [unclassified Thioalkalivibrio]|uniref:C40 family peptidase n=1 Tax=unclassified Thioalkalivibrio TaxID=2621013 RepID=UPI00036BCCC9|nr:MULTISPECIES: NlpC/P60 family protein [unclassified Thioalkalivibrio]